MNQLLANILLTEDSEKDPENTSYQIDSVVAGSTITVSNDLRHQPKGIRSLALKAHIKYPDVLDFSVVVLDKPGTVAGVFTRNRSASPAVQIGKAHVEDGQAQALVVISKNANLFTPTAYDDTLALVEGVGAALNIPKTDVLPSCTGIIGVPLPMSNVRAAIEKIPSALQPGLIDEFAQAILTTDKKPKSASIKFGDVVICGVAKGAGMIEPNMATMLAYFFTNLKLSGDQLKAILKRVCDSTFNSISVDSDTSTSDSVMIFSTNEIEPEAKHLQDFEAALGAMALKLAKDMVYQAEGATKLIEVTVAKARSEAHAKAVAKLIVNSPLVKTAIFGSDPNWGRVAMAIGKPLADDEPVYDPRNIKITVSDIPLFMQGQSTDVDLQQLQKKMQQDKTINISVELGEGDARWMVWGCDLSYRYVEINAEYST